jgi:hypothetical protein
LLDQGRIAGEVSGERGGFELRDGRLHLQRGVHDVLACEESPFAVFEPGRHEVGVHLVERAVRHSGEDGIERQAGGDGFADFVETECLLEAQVFGGEPLLFEAALHDHRDFFDLERLQNVVVGAALHGVDRRFDGAETGHDDGERVGRDFGDRFQELHAAHARHLEVADDEVVVRATQLGERARAVLGRAHHIPLHPQELGQDLANALLIVDDKDARAFLWRWTERHVRAPWSLFLS